MIRKNLESRRRIPFIEDERGRIGRVAEANVICQIFVPRKLRQLLLHLAHYTPLAGHSEVIQQFYSMRSQWYCPSIIVDIRSVSQQCHPCARERIRIRSHQAPLKLFRPTKPLKFIAIDILGSLPRATSGYRFILAITDRFSKLTRAVPPRSIKALPAAKALVQD